MQNGEPHDGLVAEHFLSIVAAGAQLEALLGFRGDRTANFQGWRNPTGGWRSDRPGIPSDATANPALDVIG